MNEISLKIDYTHYDRSFRLPISILFEFAQKCRLGIYTKGAIGKLRSIGTIMVKAQAFQFENDVKLPSNGDEIKITQEIKEIGKSSFTFSIHFSHSEGIIFASGIVVMVFVANGKSSQIPQEIVQELSITREEVEDTKKRIKPSKTIKETIENMKLNCVNWEIKVTQEIILRSSDEDTNKHVRHLKYAQFFEDALQELENPPASSTLQFMSMEYIKETHRREKCSVRVKIDGNFAEFLMYRNDDELVARGFASWSTELLSAKV